ncbi:MAG: BTAD domain-containing putative transcriptional regulator [Ornithinimicrobium sp.]
MNPGTRPAVGLLGEISILRPEAASLGATAQGRLLALLGLHAEQAVSTVQLIEWLWPASPAPASAKGVIQVNASRLRQLLGPGVTIEGRTGSYALRGEGPLTDVALFETIVARVRRTGRTENHQDQQADLDAALGLWRGVPLHGLDDIPIVEHERTRLEELRRNVEEERMEAAMSSPASSATSAALDRDLERIAECRRLVEQDPYRENRRRLLMLALYRADRQAEALAAYADAVRLLRDELGIDPGAQLRRAHERILLQDPELEVKPVAALLPVPDERTDLIGRQSLVRDVRRYLETHRLVTLTGAGGVGKTRIAGRVAARAEDSFRQGVAWVDVATLDPTTFTAVVAASLGIESLSPAEVASLRDRQKLLVLDTCEAMLPEVRALLDTILGQPSGLKVLATSRESLGVAGERTIVVPGLLASNPGDPTTEAGVQLLQERMIDAGATSGHHPDHVLARVVEHLDGIPLAIELAAHRLSRIPTQQVIDYLDQEVTTSLRGHRAAGPARQRSMDATVEWSYQHLTSRSRRGLLAAGALPDGIDTEHMAAALESDAADAEETLDDLTSRALLSFRQGRYRAHDGVKDFSSRTIDHDEHGRGLKTALAATLRDSARQTAAAYYSTERASVYARTSEQDQNHVRAIQWMLRDGNELHALEHTVALGRYWGQCGQASTRVDFLHKVRVNTPNTPTPLRVQAALIGSWLSLWANRMDEADESVADALSLAQRSGDPSLLGMSLHGRGNIEAFGRGRVADGCRSFHEAVGLLSPLAHPYLPAVQCSYIWALAVNGAVDLGYELLSDARQRFAASHDPITEFGLWMSEGLLGVYSGRLDLVDMALERALDATEAFSVGQMRSQVTCVLAWAALCRDEGTRALRLSRLALDQSRDAGAVSRDGYILALAALSAARMGDVRASTSLALRAIEASGASDERESLALAVMARSVCARIEGRSEDAVSLWREAAAIRTEAGVSLPPAVESWAEPVNVTSRRSSI